MESNLDNHPFTRAYCGEDYDLMKRKGVYSYGYMDGFERFKEKELPSKEWFYTKLNVECISYDDYNHSLKVWEKCKNVGDYHDLYLKSDVLLLADVLENFRKTCSNYYGLDPCHYFSSPGLAWDAMLKMTKINLDLITGIDMYLVVEKGLSGGIRYIANR